MSCSFLGPGHRLRVSHEAARASLRISTPVVGKSVASHRFTSLQIASHRLTPCQIQVKLKGQVRWNQVISCHTNIILISYPMSYPCNSLGLIERIAEGSRGPRGLGVPWSTLSWRHETPAQTRRIWQDESIWPQS